jgi:catechol 2,3-dioxygenase
VGEFADASSKGNPERDNSTRKRVMSKILLSHLAHVELITPKLNESANFFVEVMGMTEVRRTSQFVYLRCWGDYYQYSLMLTQGSQPALGHAAWRSVGAAELEEAASRVQTSGTTGEWRDDSYAHGRSFRFQGPGGHPIELFWDVDRHIASGDLKSTFPERPQKLTNHGIAPRQLDHVTVATNDVIRDAKWYRKQLGFRFMAFATMHDNPNQVVFGTVTTNEKSHDLGLGVDFSAIRGRLHHLAFWVDSADEHLRCADLLMESGAGIEYGPGRHGIGEQYYLYFREPGGLRIEVNTGGYRNYVPDWEPVKWDVSQGPNTMYRNIGMPDSMMEAFPPDAGPVVPDIDLQPEPATVNPWKKHG